MSRQKIAAMLGAALPFGVAYVLLVAKCYGNADAQPNREMILGVNAIGIAALGVVAVLAIARAWKERP